MDICFEWPRPTGLIYTMHEVMRGLCNKEIGYTLREGGYNSPVGDRHNWNGYIVDGRERRLTFAEAKLMQGFPKNFYLPPPMADSTGVKLLGNAVPINVVKAILTQILIWKERFQSYGS
jgi:DNA (cytosine-5)-methyltransferase 1